MILALLLASADAWADVRRWAVVVGNNEGFVGTRSLYFAEHDARKIKSILNTLGDVSEGDTRVLLGGSRTDVFTTLAALKQPITDAKLRGDQTILYFYYSGHADGAQLQLGRSSLKYPELEEVLEDSGADVRVAFVDACQSGALTRAKGGTMAPSFVLEVNESLSYEGSVFFTSSSDDEASQESNEIGGSYFTHFLASALSGAADIDRDGRVTLDETYQYVFHETLYRTAGTRGGPQHATQESKLTGSGELVLTELARSGAVLLFPADNPGSFVVFDVDRRMFVAEVDSAGVDQKLSLRPGRYLVQRRYPTYLSVADIVLAKGGNIRVSPAMFRALEYEDDVAKGSVEQVIREGNLPKLSVRTLFGGRGFGEDVVQREYFPGTPTAGAEARLHWRDGRWASADFLGGSGIGELSFAELPYTVPVRLDTAAVGVGAGYATAQAPFRIAAGIHLQGIYLNRSFPGSTDPSQELFTVAPGLMFWAGWYPRRFELELALRSHYLPYVVDGRDTGMSYSELVLAAGYRF